MKTPKPFDESKCTNKKWNEDVFDPYIPKRKGFITDCIYMLRGSEAPTMFTIWSALVVLSMVIKREAWLKFGLTKKFANLYVILIGKAGLAKKTFSISQIAKALSKSGNYIKNSCWKKIKRFVTMTDQLTPESMVAALAASVNTLETGFGVTFNGKPVLDQDGKQLVYDRPSEMLIIAEELANFLGKQSYQEGMIALLLSLYDNKDSHKKMTITHGEHHLKNLYTSFLGGTTPDGFANSIPQTAKGDGFLSRVILANTPDTGRVCPVPEIIEGAPTHEDLAERLAWISLTTTGEFTFTKEAYNWYVKWYHRLKKTIKDSEEWATVNSRMDNHLLKVALLIRANLYETSKEITVEDLQEADALLKATAGFSKFVLNDIDAGDWGKGLNKVHEYIASKVKVQRTTLLRTFSKTMKSREINEVLDRLLQEERIMITNTNGREISAVRSEGTDWYHYKLV